MCGRPAAAEDLTAEGTYAHLACLRANSVPFTGRNDKGGYLYGGDR